jgi:AhpD family alkylhydroperoxidase
MGGADEERAVNLLTDMSAAEPVGAAALLALGDPEELARFRFLEDRIWDSTTLPAPVIEAVRIRSARIRGCEFCASVRMSGAFEAGLSEAQLMDQDSPEGRRGLPEDQRAALRLVDAFLIEGTTPPAEEVPGLVEALGAAGVVEVLVACAVFASADLRIALGDNREANSTTIERVHTFRPHPSATGWPALSISILPPAGPIPLIDGRIDEALGGLRAALFAQSDVPGRILAMCLVRSAQLLGASDGSARGELLAPAALRPGVDGQDVEAWTRDLEGLDRHVMAFAEQLWLDPSGLDEGLVTPLREALGDAALIRSTWRLIWIGQLQRISMVLGPEGAA